jgi:hypothetical protein
MIERLREFLNTLPGKIAGVVIALVLLFMMGYEVRQTFGDPPAAKVTRTRTFVCSETGKSFEVTLKPGMTMPVKSPFTGRATGYEFDEVCGWTADGHVAPKPTFVLLNKKLHKKGPTFCPTCDRLVVENNPPAEEGAKPPPTRAEYERRRTS